MHYLKYLLPILIIATLLYFLPERDIAFGADSGFLLPTTGSNDASSGSAAWANPSNILSDNGSNAVTTGGFEAGNEFSDNAIYVVKADGAIGSENKSVGTSLPTLVMAVATYGGPTDTWGETWTPADINDADFGFVFQTTRTGSVLSNYLKATNFGFTIPTDATIDGIEAQIERAQFSGDSTNSTAAVDYMSLKVYYTEAAPEDPDAAGSASLRTGSVQIRSGQLQIR